MQLLRNIFGGMKASCLFTQQHQQQNRLGDCQEFAGSEFKMLRKRWEGSEESGRLWFVTPPENVMMWGGRVLRRSVWGQCSELGRVFYFVWSDRALTITSCLQPPRKWIQEVWVRVSSLCEPAEESRVRGRWWWFVRRLVGWLARRVPVCWFGLISQPRRSIQCA